MQASSVDTTFAAHGQDEEMIFVHSPEFQQHRTGVHMAGRLQAHKTVSVLESNVRVHGFIHSPEFQWVGF